MLCKDAQGRELEISFYGPRDDIQVSEANYIDSDDEVTDDTIDYIMDAYASEIDEDRVQSAVMRAEAYYEGDR